MNSKQQLLAGLTEIYTKWEELLAGLDEKQILEPLVPSDWTIKDIVAHMWSWQQASVARAEAALKGKEPDYPKWWQINGPDPDEDVDRTNAWIYNANKAKPWSKVYADWKLQFQRYLELSNQIPEKDLLEPGKYAWMGTSALAASTNGSLEHHIEHFETLKAWLRKYGKMKASGYA